ncbi:signal peptidase I [Hymenobacter algoricola]|uniref:Signal peptidase I n=1 Tax=Hymenobacter algoricola TaxID=486267 RepID=A0ABP7MAI1_9BACT
MAVQSWEERTAALNTATSASPQQKPKGFFREWGDAILFAVVAATLIRWATFEAYTIPTPSMEHTLLVGDYLFVSKLHYGPRTPQTPLQVPLTHQTIWGTSIPSYSDALQLTSYRLPGFSEVKRNDVVVFNVPFEKEHPADLRTNYIKRCIGIAGDVLELREQQVYINGKPAPNPVESQNRYTLPINSDETIRGKVFQDQGIYEYGSPDGSPQARITAVGPGYVVDMTPKTAAYFKQQSFVRGVVLDKSEPGVGEPEVFPNNPDYPSSQPNMGASPFKNWNKDNYGPLQIPKAGQTVQLTPANTPIYQKIIMRYEQNEGVTLENGMLLQNDKALTSYTFKQDYFFMMGDNRHDSLDSRYWGFVPKDHIVGKAVLIWMSVNPYADFFHKIRWSRLFNFIN